MMTMVPTPSALTEEPATMERHIRNQAVIEAYEAGEPVAALAERFDLSQVWLKQILRQMEPYSRLRDQRPLPHGISVVTAVTIEQAIGIWPSIDTLFEIENRKIDLFRSSARGKKLRIALSEIETAILHLRRTPCGS